MLVSVKRNLYTVSVYVSVSVSVCLCVCVSVSKRTGFERACHFLKNLKTCFILMLFTCACTQNNRWCIHD